MNAIKQLAEQDFLIAKIRNIMVEQAIEDMPVTAREQLELVLAASGETILLLKQQLDTLKSEKSADTTRLIAANARLKTKNGNYRLGMKQLQKAHEALLYRFQTLKNSVDYRHEEEKRVAAEQQESQAAIQQNGYIASPARQEPGYDDYFRGRVVEGNINSQFQNRAQVSGIVNTRL